MELYTEDEYDAADAALAHQQEVEHERLLEEQEEQRKARWKAELDKELKILETDPDYNEWLDTLETNDDHRSS